MKEKKQIREVLVKDIHLYYTLTFGLIIFIWVCFTLLYFKTKIPLYITIPISTVLTFLLLKYHLIGIVLLYKAFAPLEVRERCRFEPTCSTYMIMALRKYGLVIGLIKGIKRILRCKPPNGGVDYP